MSGEAIAIVGAILGAFAAVILALATHMFNLRDRVGRIEEWIRLAEKED